MRRYTRFQLTGSELQLACLSFSVLLSLVAVGATSLFSNASEDPARPERDARAIAPTALAPARAVEGVSSSQTDPASQDRATSDGGGQTHVGVREHWCHSTRDAAYGRNLTDEVESCDVELEEPASIQTISSGASSTSQPASPTSVQSETDGLDNSDESLPAPVQPSQPEAEEDESPTSTTNPPTQEPEQATSTTAPGDTPDETAVTVADEPDEDDSIDRPDREHGDDNDDDRDDEDRDDDDRDDDDRDDDGDDD